MVLNDIIEQAAQQHAGGHRPSGVADHHEDHGGESKYSNYFNYISTKVERPLENSKEYTKSLYFNNFFSELGLMSPNI